MEGNQTPKLTDGATAAPPDTLRLAHDGRAAALALLPTVAGLTLFVLGPLVASIWLSLQDWSLADGMHFIGLDNYTRLLFKDRVFWRTLQNTALLALVMVPLNIGIATLGALWLRTNLKFKPALRIFFLLPCLTPMVANALVWRFVLADGGPLNQLLGLVGLPQPVWFGSGGWAMASIIIVTLWQSFGYNMIVLEAGLNGLDPALNEAARIDGAGPLQRLRLITLPLLSPSLFFCTVMTTIGGLQIFAQPYVMTKGGPGQDTNTLVLYLYQNAFSYDALGFASALGWVVFVLVMLITALQFIGQRKLVHYAQ